MQHPTTRRLLCQAWAFALSGLILLASGVLSAQERVPVSLVEATREEIVEELSLTGTLTSRQAAELSTEVEGRVAAIDVDAGQRVGAGDTLVTLDDELARLEVAQARAALREAAADLEDARRRLSEVRDLSRQRGIVAETEVRAREAEVERDSAVVERRRAEVAHREALLRRYTLTAPFDGVIARRSCDLGEWVGPDAPVMELVAVDVLRLDLQVPQGYFGRIGHQTAVSLRLEALPTERVDATITEIVPVSDPTARTFLARINLPNDEGRMTPGMSARAVLRIATGEQGVAVPRDALVRYPDGRIVVWVARPDGDAHTVSERQVRTGLAFGGKIQIASGLEVGTSVVVRGNEVLREGQKVRVEGDG
jgi:membrane fusion protein (multidrug efflux system)